LKYWFICTIEKFIDSGLVSVIHKVENYYISKTHSLSYYMDTFDDEVKNIPSQNTDLVQRKKQKIALLLNEYSQTSQNVSVLKNAVDLTAEIANIPVNASINSFNRIVMSKVGKILAQNPSEQVVTLMSLVLVQCADSDLP